MFACFIKDDQQGLPENFNFNQVCTFSTRLEARTAANQTTNPSIQNEAYYIAVIPQMQHSKNELADYENVDLVNQ